MNVRTTSAGDQADNKLSGLHAALAPLSERWRALTPRDRNMVALAGVVLCLFLVWTLALQPALRTLSSAPAELDALDLELQTMQRLATESTELRAAPAVTAAQAVASLQAATAALGEQGKLSLQGERAVLTLSGVGTAALGEWLAAARAGARARPVEATFTRAAQGYNGTLVVAFGNGS
jgi:general secretion pathway protein M